MNEYVEELEYINKQIRNIEISIRRCINKHNSSNVELNNLNKKLKIYNTIKKVLENK